MTEKNPYENIWEEIGKEVGADVQPPAPRKVEWDEDIFQVALSIAERDKWILADDALPQIMERTGCTEQQAQYFWQSAVAVAHAPGW